MSGLAGKGGTGVLCSPVSLVTFGVGLGDLFAGRSLVGDGLLVQPRCLPDRLLGLGPELLHLFALCLQGGAGILLRVCSLRLGMAELPLQALAVASMVVIFRPRHEPAQGGKRADPAQQPAGEGDGPGG